MIHRFIFCFGLLAAPQVYAGTLICETGPNQKLEVTGTYTEKKMGFTKLLDKGERSYLVTKSEGKDPEIQIYIKKPDGKANLFIKAKPPIVVGDIENGVTINCHFEK